MKNGIDVIKIGGSVVDTRDSIKKILISLDLTSYENRVVIVHGGGNAINSSLLMCGINSEFVDGQRVTDHETLKVVEMVLSARVNKEIVSVLNSIGIKAVGISGRDGGSVKSSKTDENLGYVGEVETVDNDLFISLLKEGYLPVVSPVSEDLEGHAININADVFAAGLAVALQADNLEMMTNTGGVLKNGAMLTSLDVKTIEELISSEIVTLGMIPKLRAAESALSGGVKSVIMMDNEARKGTIIK